MAYFVAKELKMRPLSILLEWTCEELLVAFAYYANINSKQTYDMLSQKERIEKRLTPDKRWAVPFVSEDQIERMAEEQREAEEKMLSDEEISKILMS